MILTTRSNHYERQDTSLCGALSRLLLTLTLSAGVLGCGATTPKPGRVGNVQARLSAEEAISQILSEEKPQAAPVPPRGIASSAPPMAMPSTAPSGGTYMPDAFKRDVSRIQEVVPTWSNGTGVALNFLKESSGARMSLLYVDPTAPEYRPDQELWMIQASAKTDTDTVGHFVLLLKSLAPGHYVGSAGNREVVMSASMGDAWDGSHPGTTWSINDESWCELILRETDTPGTLEGDFRAKLVDNVGTGFHHIESGYLYIKQ